MRRARAMGAAVALLGLAGCGLIAGLSDHELDTRAQDGGLGEVGTSGDADGRPDAPGLTDAACSNDLQNDPKHCGSCGHDCMGGECKAGACQPVLLAGSEGALPLQIAVIKDEVFWIQEPPSTMVFRVPPKGPLETTHPTKGIAPLGSRLIVGFKEEAIKQGTSVLDPSSGTRVVRGENIDTIAVSSDNGRVFALGLGPGGIFVEAFESSDADNIPMTRVQTSSGARGIFAGGGNVAYHAPYALFRCSGRDCSWQTAAQIVPVDDIDQNQAEVRAGLTADAMFFTESLKRKGIHRVNLDGGSLTQIGAWNARSTSLVLDGTYVYVSRQGGEVVGGADVVRCLQSGCTAGPTVLFQGTAARALAVGERAIYWAGTKDGKTGVWLLAK